MNEFYEFIKYLNIPSLLIVLFTLWRFLKSFRVEMLEERKEMIEERKIFREEMRELKEEIKGIHREFKFINIRLSRVEGTIYGKDIYKPSPHEENSSN